MRRLSILIHGDSGVGKTPLANTAPGPRLLIDTEGGWQYLPNKTVSWDPRTAPPTDIDSNTTVVVRINDNFQLVDLVYQWLSSGQHPFKSLIIDSLTEMQEKMKKSISAQSFVQQDWGTLLERMNTLILQFKDLADDEAPFPLECVVFTAGSEYSDKVLLKTASVQGSLIKRLPYKVAVCAYMDRTPEDQPFLLISKVNSIQAKDRTTLLKAKYGQTIPPNANNEISIQELFQVLNPEINQESVA